MLDDLFVGFTTYPKLIPSKGAPTAEPVFASLTFPLSPRDNSKRSEWAREWVRRRQKLDRRLNRSFPRQLWRSTREWAADWLDYQAAVDAAGGRLYPRLPKDAAGAYALHLSTTQASALGLKHGYCDITETGGDVRLHTPCTKYRRGRAYA